MESTRVKILCPVRRRSVTTGYNDRTVGAAENQVPFKPPDARNGLARNRRRRRAAPCRPPGRRDVPATRRCQRRPAPSATRVAAGAAQSCGRRAITAENGYDGAGPARPDRRARIATAATGCPPSLRTSPAGGVFRRRRDGPPRRAPAVPTRFRFCFEAHRSAPGPPRIRRRQGGELR